MKNKLFPIVDISYVMDHYGCDEFPTKTFLEDERVKQASKELMCAFSEWGFIYLKGYGISNSCVENAFKQSLDFFMQSTDEKNKTLLSSLEAEDLYGYVPFKYECFDTEKPFDLKEAFDFLPWMDKSFCEKLPIKFVHMFEDLYEKCIRVSILLCRLIAIGLNLEDVNFIVKSHKDLKTKGNISILRTLYYPGIKPVDIEPNQSRCGEHSDYGTITLLFQDDVGGLEVQSPNRDFVCATPIPETIVVNAADLLERWSSNKIKSTRHRVTLPTDVGKPRQSIAFFVQPDNDCVVSCLDGSNMYESVNSKDYILEQLNKTFTLQNT